MPHVKVQPLNVTNIFSRVGLTSTWLLCLGPDCHRNPLTATVGQARRYEPFHRPFFKIASHCGNSKFHHNLQSIPNISTCELFLLLKSWAVITHGYSRNKLSLWLLECSQRPSRFSMDLHVNSTSISSSFSAEKKQEI